MYKPLRLNMRNITSFVIVLLLCISLWQLAIASWTQGKAIIAQHLLNYSWNQVLNKSQKNKNHANKSQANKNLTNTIHTNKTQKSLRPWPWADTWPVAKLIVPQHNIEQIILAGDSGSTLAFAPGFSLASKEPNTTGLTMISAHRDTHFSFLENIKAGDAIYLQTPGKTVLYEVYDIKIVDSKTFTVSQDDDNKTLVLVTCFPFNTVLAGGSYRYLVYASTLTI